MNYKDRIIEYLSDNVCKEIAGKVIQSLRKMTEGMQSGDDTPLRSIWDEVCVQTQVEYSVMWDAYAEIIIHLIDREVRKRDDRLVGAIWLQTDEGEYWVDEIQDRIDSGEIQDYQQDTIDYNSDDVNQHILDEYILKTAGNWTNKRIKKYIDAGYEL